MEHEQFNELIVEKDAALKITSTCFVNMKKKVATVETEEGLPPKSDAKLLSYAR